MAKLEVMDLTVACQSFPELPKPEIRRENFLDTIDTIFESNTQLVVIEGAEGIGKTTLLAQFARRHPDRALSLFIKPTSRWGYDPEILRFDLCNQLNWILCQEELSPTEDIGDGFLRTGLLGLRKRARHLRSMFYFVVDGLDEIPEQDVSIRHLVLEMLPLGLPSFRFLLSGDLDHLSGYIPQGVSHKSYPLSGFTLDQTVNYFEGLAIDRPSIEEIYKICRKIPGHLATVRRILLSGTSVQTLFEEMPDQLPDLFEIEWRRVRANDENQLHLLAILAHDRRRHSIDDLAHILDLQPGAVDNLLQDLGFVFVDPANREASFVSETFRKFAAVQLRHLKDTVNALLVNDLLREPDSERARVHLPGYLQEAGHLEDLLTYLSPDHFPRMLELSKSLGPAKQQAELGVNTARELRRDGDLMRFSAQRSAMLELDGAKVWRSEIEARMASGDYDAAINLAQSAVLTEERLHLLAIVAKAQREQGLAPEPEIVEQIRQLYNQIDLTSLGEQAVEIASDLLYSNANLAIDMVEKATNSGVDENALDWAFAKLSIVALSANSEQYQTADTVEVIRSRIKDPRARRFSTAASLLIEDYSAAEVIAQVQRLESTDDRLYLLRRWTMDNREREDAWEVVDFALDLAIKTTPYSPNAGVLREIATPLPFLPDELKARQLVSRFDGQKGTVERLGPTEDYVRLQLLLAQTESKYDFDAARSRLVDIYLTISYLEDLAVKTGCMARLAATLEDMDPQKTLETEDEIHTLTKNDVYTNTQQLLDATAEHYSVTRSIVRALTKSNPDMALKVAQALNTQARRDLALLDLINSAIQAPTDKLDLAFIECAVGQLVDLDLRDEAVLNIMSRLSSASEKNEALAAAALPLINRVGDIQDASERCNACCLAHSFLVEQDPVKYSGLVSHLLHILETAWRSLNVGWRKIDVGFKIVDALAEHSIEMARQYLEWTEQYRKEIILDAHPTALTYLGCLRLAIRAYGGLLLANLNSVDDLESLAHLIDRVPSDGERAGLWAELALRCYVNGQLDDCKRIVTERVKPGLMNIAEQDGRYLAEVTIAVAPALFCAHQRTALDQISKLPPSLRDGAYAHIAEFIFHKQSSSDPYDVLPGQEYDLTHEEIVDICDLLELMDNDGLIYHLVEKVSDSVVSRGRKNPLSRQQKADIADCLAKVVNAKLPNRQRHIKHEGYKVAALAQVARIQRAKPEQWLDLVESARQIPNLADRVLVLCMVAIAMPDKDRRKQVLEEAKNLIEEIPTALDRIHRYEEFASRVVNIDSPLSREYLKLAMQSAVESDRPELYPVQRQIIDLAYKLDQDLAASLASMADDDPARATTHTNLKRRYQVLDLKNKMANESLSDTASSKSDYSRAAWMLLGTLNAKRVKPFGLDCGRELIQVASDLPFSQSYPILACVIENMIQRYSKTDHASKYLRPIYEAILSVTELAARMAARSTGQLEQARCQSFRTSTSTSVLIRSGDREAAMQFLKDWFEHQVKDYLKICDPYFGLEELEILQLLHSVNPACRVQVLTSKKHHKKVPPPWEDAYRTHWRLHVSEQDPPVTEILIVGTESDGKLPIHDRWLLTSGGGIRTGTSLNSLGVGRDSEISYLTEEDAKIRETEVDRYLQRIERDHSGERLLYTLFTL